MLRLGKGSLHMGPQCEQQPGAIIQVGSLSLSAMGLQLEVAGASWTPPGRPGAGSESRARGLGCHGPARFLLLHRDWP
jgi:hypothetical protein